MRKTEKAPTVKVPFEGFYNSIHDHMFDMALESINCNDAGEEAGIIEMDNVRWNEVCLSYAQAYLREAVKDSGIPMRFERIISSSDYAVEADRLIARLPAGMLQEAFDAMTPEAQARWSETVKNAMTPKDGYAPFLSTYSDDAAEWGGPTQWDDAQRDLFFHFHAAPLMGDEAGLAERASEMLDEAIWRAVIDPDKVPGHVDNRHEQSVEP